MTNRQTLAPYRVFHPLWFLLHAWNRRTSGGDLDLNPNPTNWSLESTTTFVGGGGITPFVATDRADQNLEASLPWVMSLVGYGWRLHVWKIIKSGSAEKKEDSLANLCNSPLICLATAATHMQIYQQTCATYVSCDKEECATCLLRDFWFCYVDFNPFVNKTPLCECKAESAKCFLLQTVA